jgi:hypothetical protein
LGIRARRQDILKATRLSTSSRKPITYPALQQIIELFLSHRPATVNGISAELDGLTTATSNIGKLNGFPSPIEFNFYIVVSPKSSLLFNKEGLNAGTPLEGGPVS